MVWGVETLPCAYKMSNFLGKGTEVGQQYKYLHITVDLLYWLIFWEWKGFSLPSYVYMYVS